MMEVLRLAPAFDTARQALLHLCEAEEGQVLHSGRNTLCCTTLSDGRTVVVKHFGRLSWPRQWWYRWMGKSKALRSFDNATSLLHRQVPTPQPVAVVEERRGVGLQRSAYVCCYSSFRPITDFVMDEEHFDHKAVAALACFVAQLHERGVLHLDLNNTNITYREQEGRYSFALIDLNRMRFAPEGQSLQRSECLENLCHFSHLSPLFHHFVDCYLEARHWPSEVKTQVLTVKQAVDEGWERKQRRKRWIRSALGLKRKA